MSPFRPNQSARALGGACIATLLALSSAGARADDYQLSASLTTFRSWIDVGNAGLPGQVNGAMLTDSNATAGTYQGTSYDWSNLVSFAAGTQSVDFGYDPSVLATRRLNSFSVAPASASVTPSPLPTSVFDLAALTFTNGQWFYQAEIGVQFVAHDVQTGVDYTYEDTVLVTSNNTTAIGVDASGHPIFDPVPEADMFTLENHPEFGSVRVYEAVAQPAGNPGFVGTGILQAQLGGPLGLTGFSSANGAAFLDSSTTAAPSGHPASVAAVPEPSSWALMLAGMALIVGCARIGRKHGA